MDKITWTGAYYKHSEGIGEYVYWKPWLPREDPPLYTTNTSFTLTKTIQYDNKEIFHRDVENLERLQEEKFSRIKVPQFTFEASNNIIVYNCQFVKGKVVQPRKLEKLYKELVLRDSEYSFCDYTIDNFIKVWHGELEGSVFAIDLNSYKKEPVENRKILWERYKKGWNKNK